jgi:hypothetical protein
VHEPVVDAAGIGVDGDERGVAAELRRRAEVALGHPRWPGDHARPVHQAVVERADDVEHLVGREHAHRAGRDVGDRLGTLRVDGRVHHPTGDAVAEPSVDRRLARPQARQDLAALAGLGEQLGHQGAHEPTPAVRGVAHDARHRGRGEPLPARHDGLDAVGPGVGDGQLPVPCAQRVRALLPPAERALERLVVGWRVEERTRDQVRQRATVLGARDADLHHGCDRGSRRGSLHGAFPR